MTHRFEPAPIRVIFALLVLVALSLVAPIAVARESWSLAGTFNAWRTDDPQWTLAQEAEPHRKEWWTLTRRLAAGKYRFKFVRDGDWSRGHLGWAGEGGGGGRKLTEPGADIELNIRAEAEYLFTLDTGARVWRFDVVHIDEPLLVVDIRGTPQVDRPFRVFTGRSLTDGGSGNVFFVVGVPDQPTQRTPDPDDKDSFIIVPSKAGAMTLMVTLHDGERSVTRRIPLVVGVASTAVWSKYDEPNRPVRMDLEAQWDGSERAIIRVDRETKFTSLAVTTGKDGSVFAKEAVVAPGVYAVEVRAGSAVTRADAKAPMLLLPGGWRRFSYRAPAPVDSVFLVGDFNDWAGAGSPGAIEMLGRADGSYSAIVKLPDGPARYAFVIDGGSRIPDPKNGREAMDPAGGRASLVIVGPTPAEFPKPRAGEINGSAVRHDPESRADFSPISRSLGIADIALSALPEDVQSATLNLRMKEGAQRIPMVRSSDAAGFDRFSARVMSGSARMTYSFTLTDGPASYETPEWTVTASPTPETPEWAKGAVWYQIFPERFRNGNPKNDPSGAGVSLKQWGSDWYKVEPAEEKAWRKRAGIPEGAPLPQRKGGPLFHVVFDRRYGGDLQGVVEKLDSIKELGVTAIYLNPIFEAESLHKYDATDYRHIDDNLADPASAGTTPDEWRPIESETPDPATWTWTPADRYFVDVFLPECHKRGLRVVLDGVFNHTGRAFWAFRDIQRRGEASPYKDWYFVTFDKEGRLASWESWFNTGSLPKFRQTPEGDLAPSVKEHIFNITKRWMDPDGDGDPSDGIDGWRLDVALDIGPPFWRDWRSLVKGINPEAIVIAEIWDDAGPYLGGEGGAFDTQMHYPFARAVTDWLGVRPGMSEFDLRRALDTAFDEPPQTNLIHQNLLDSHDTDRFVSMLLNPGREYDQGNRPQDHDFPYVDRRPPEGVYKRSLLGVALQATWLGAPMIYYGDEVGMWGADDPSDRKPYPWADRAPEVPDERANPALRAQYRKWFSLRSDPALGPILRYGSLRHLSSGDPNVLAFERALSGRRVLVVINRQETPFDASKLLGGGGGGRGCGVDTRF